MASFIGDLIVRFGADTTKFNKGVTGVQKRMAGVGNAAMAMGAKIRGAIGLLGGIAGAAGLAWLVKGQFAAMDATAKFADRIGIATEKLAGLHHAAGLAGMGTSALNMALQRMTRRISEAAAGSGEAQGALKELGLDAKALNAMTPDQALGVIADALAGVTSQADRLRLAFKLFDAEGTAILPMLMAGSAGLRSAQEEAERLGMALSGLDHDKIEAANDAVARMKGAFKGLAMQVALAIAPIVEDLATGVAERMPAVVDWIKRTSSAVQELWERFTNSPVLMFIAKLTLGVLAFAAALGPIIWIATKVGTALSMAFAFLTSPVGAFIALLGAAAYALIQLCGEGDTFLEKFLDVTDKIAKAFKSAWTWIKSFVIGVIKKISSVFMGTMAGIGAAWRDVWEANKRVFEIVAGTVKAFFAGIAEAWDALKGGNITGIVAAFQKGMAKEMSKLENVVFPDVFRSFTDAYNEAADKCAKKLGSFFGEDGPMVREMRRGTAELDRVARGGGKIESNINAAADAANRLAAAMSRGSFEEYSTIVAAMQQKLAPGQGGVNMPPRQGGNVGGGQNAPPPQNRPPVKGVGEEGWLDAAKFGMDTVVPDEIKGTDGASMPRGPSVADFMEIFPNAEPIPQGNGADRLARDLATLDAQLNASDAAGSGALADARARAEADKAAAGDDIMDALAAVRQPSLAGFGEEPPTADVSGADRLARDLATLDAQLNASDAAGVSGADRLARDLATLDAQLNASDAEKTARSRRTDPAENVTAKETAKSTARSAKLLQDVSRAMAASEAHLATIAAEFAESEEVKML